MKDLLEIMGQLEAEIDDLKFSVDKERKRQRRLEGILFLVTKVTRTEAVRVWPVGKS